MPWSPLGTRKTEFRILAWNFAQKQASMRVVYCESLRSFGCSYPKIRLKRMFLHCSYTPNMFQCSYFRIGTTKRSETFTINYSHWGLFLCQVSSRNSKFSFGGAPKGDHGFVLKNIIKMQYLDSNKLAARTLFRVFIAH